MTSWILMPPIAFALALAAVLALSRAMKGSAFRGEEGPGAESAYSCGEDMAENSYRPDYGQFFRYAFFFTIMHVAALSLATVPSSGDKTYLWMAALYIAAAMIGLSALLGKER
jgi:hypothetical protein